jgi:hypothetical protein
VEDVEPAMIEQLAARGVRYLGNEAHRYYCYPAAEASSSPTDPFPQRARGLAAATVPAKPAGRPRKEPGGGRAQGPPLRHGDPAGDR